MKSRIIGTGSYAPDKVITNHDLEGMVETSDEWIRSRTGIRERRVAVDEGASEMASKAARRALKAAGLSARDIDLVVVGTVTPDMAFPSTACFVQSRLGIRSGVPAFDVAAACSGFLYAIDVADRYVRTGAAARALVVGVDKFSELIDWTDRTTCVLFGDGAGAVVLSAEKGGRGGRGILSSHIHSDGRKWDMLYTKGTCLRSPFEKESDCDPFLKMHGNDTFKVAVRTMEAAVREALDSNGLGTEDVGLLIPHQANERIINATRERLKLPEDRVYTNLDRYGNTSAGSIPLALDEAVCAGRVADGDILIFVAFGGGLTWASTAVRW